MRPHNLNNIINNNSDNSLIQTSNQELSFAIENFTCYNIPDYIVSENEKEGFIYKLYVYNKNYCFNGEFMKRQLSEEELKKIEEAKKSKKKPEQAILNTEPEELLKTSEYFEDITKCPCIKFPENIQINLNNEELVIFEENILKPEDNCGFNIILVRESNLSTEEKEKNIKKMKLNNYHYTPLYYQGFININKFKNNNITEDSYKIELSCFDNLPLDEEETEEMYNSKMEYYINNIRKDVSNFYIRFNLKFNNKLVYEYKENFKLNDFINKNIKQLSNSDQNKDIYKDINKEYKKFINKEYQYLTKYFKNIMTSGDYDNSDAFYFINNGSNVIYNKFIAEVKFDKDYDKLYNTIKNIALKYLKILLKYSNEKEKIDDKYLTKVYYFMCNKLFSYTKKSIANYNDVNNLNYIKQDKYVINNIKMAENISNNNIVNLKLALFKQYYNSKRFELAGIALNKIINTKHNNDKVYKYQAKLELNNKSYIKAETNINNAIKINKNKRKYLYIIIFIYLSRKKYKDAFLYLKALMDKTNSLTYNLLLYILYKCYFENKQFADKQYFILKRIVLRKLNYLDDVSYKLSFSFSEEELYDSEVNNYIDSKIYKLLKILLGYNFTDVYKIFLDVINDKANENYLFFNYELNIKHNSNDCNVINDYINGCVIYKNYFKLELATILYNNKNYEELELLLIEIFKIKDLNNKLLTKALYLLYKVQKNKNNLESCKIILFKLNQINKNNIIYLNKISKIYYLLDNFSEAENYFKVSNLLDPFNSETWTLIIEILRKYNYKQRIIQSVKELNKCKYISSKNKLKVKNILLSINEDKLSELYN